MYFTDSHHSEGKVFVESQSEDWEWIILELADNIVIPSFWIHLDKVCEWPSYESVSMIEQCIDERDEPAEGWIKRIISKVFGTSCI